jgi:hypothetical protein
MGCNITIVRPEHKILDLCNEICRLACSNEDQTNCDSSTGSSHHFSHSIDNEITICCNCITEIAKSCDMLPQYCLREIRHAVETIHFKKPEVFERLSKLCDATILAVRRKTLGLQTHYSCIYSPNQGELKLDFSKVEEIIQSSSPRKTTSPSHTNLILPPAVPNVDPVAQSPSKTPSMTPTPSPRPNPTPSSKPTPSLHKKIDSKRRATCPTPAFHPSELVRLKSLNENDDTVAVDYGFYNDDELNIFEV